MIYIAKGMLWYAVLPLHMVCRFSGPFILVDELVCGACSIAGAGMRFVRQGFFSLMRSAVSCSSFVAAAAAADGSVRWFFIPYFRSTAILGLSFMVPRSLFERMW